jgi:LysM repeat protein
MKKNILWLLPGLIFVVIASGCSIRTYSMVKDRIDQDLTTGNRGYLIGKAPQAMETKERSSTRTTYVTEIELPTLSKLGAKSKPKTEQEPPLALAGSAQKQSQKTLSITSEHFETYKVINGDTLEKIAKKFYGTTQKWIKIYEANKDKLKAPDKIYPGQIINIPVENPKRPKKI